MSFAPTIETDEHGNRHWRCEGWTVTTLTAGFIDISTPYSDDPELLVSVGFDGKELGVFGEWSHPTGLEHAGTIVSIPLPVLSEIVRLMEMQAERLEGESDAV